jgi:glycosyltransferase involved in cell wall biosynthesis
VHDVAVVVTEAHLILDWDEVTGRFARAGYAHALASFAAAADELFGVALPLSRRGARSWMARTRQAARHPRLARRYREIVTLPRALSSPRTTRRDEARGPSSGGVARDATRRSRRRQAPPPAASPKTPPSTYYRVTDPTISFGIVAEHHLFWLPRLGVEVVDRPLYFGPEELSRTEPATPIAVINTLFDFYSWGGLSFDDVVDGLRRRHDTLLGMEVADTTRISRRFSSWANHPGIDGIMLPSQFSLATFRKSGVTNALECVPYGVLTARPSSRFAFLRVDERPKALVFANRWPHRKGLDIIGRLVPEFDDCVFVIKGIEHHDLDARPNVIPVTGWLSEPDLASLYTNCDFLIALHRGGAFEMNCADAAGYGLPVVATSFGGVTEYLDPTWLVGGNGVERAADSEVGADHCGEVVTPDLEHAKEVIAQLLADLPAAQQRAQQHARRIRKELSWEQSTRRLLAFASERARTPRTR